MATNTPTRRELTRVLADELGATIPAPMADVNAARIADMAVDGGGRPVIPGGGNARSERMMMADKRAGEQAWRDTMADYPVGSDA